MKKSNQLGQLVKNSREGLSLTQHELAEKLGIQASHVSFIESGRRKPSLTLIARLAAILKLDPQHMLVLAHPEAEALVAESKAEPRKADFAYAGTCGAF